MTLLELEKIAMNMHWPPSFELVIDELRKKYFEALKKFDYTAAQNAEEVTRTLVLDEYLKQAREMITKVEEYANKEGKCN